MTNEVLHSEGRYSKSTIVEINHVRDIITMYHCTISAGDIHCNCVSYYDIDVNIN